MAIVEVQFPVVSPSGVSFATVRAERAAHLDDNDRSPVRGELPPAGRSVIADARAHEPAERRLDGVMLRVLSSGFDGTSYGLALALADKFARYAAPEGRRIVATGVVEPGGDGRLAAVDGFDRKVAALLAGADAGAPTLFACPAANLAALPADARAALRAAEAQGQVTVRAADTVAHFSDLWSGGAAAARRRRPILTAALALAVASVVGGATVAVKGPAWRCEGAVRALDRLADRPHIADAVEACSAAARARPQDGRVQFLAGQTHALNGGHQLARAYWSRAAELEDVNGMATWGRELWLSSPDDPKATRAALSWLGRAAARRSATAMEDIAEIYLDGRGVPADQQLAQQWLQRARALKKDKS